MYMIYQAYINTHLTGQKVNLIIGFNKMLHYYLSVSRICGMNYLANDTI